MKDAFSMYHPIVNLIFFLAVLGFSAFLQHPVCIVLEILTAVAYGVLLRGKEAVMSSMVYLLPVSGLIILLNPLFNHQGLTVLGYFSGGNPFTLEAIIYGMVAAGILLTFVQWFVCWNQIMTTDKLVYLFGRLAPALSLVVAMTFRFIPMYGKQYKAVAAAQRQLGHTMEQGNLIGKMRTSVRIFSIMLTWAMEHAIETANSMKNRGYGLPGRTAFSLYKWTKRDTVALLIFLLLSGIVGYGVATGRLYWGCFPTFSEVGTDWQSMGIYICYGILLLFPMLADGVEAVQFYKADSRR